MFYKAFGTRSGGVRICSVFMSGLLLTRERGGHCNVVKYFPLLPLARYQIKLEHESTEHVKFFFSCLQFRFLDKKQKHFRGIAEGRKYQLKANTRRPCSHSAKSIECKILLKCPKASDIMFFQFQIVVLIKSNVFDIFFKTRDKTKSNDNKSDVHFPSE